MVKRRLSYWLAGVLLVFASQVVPAAPNFVASSRVSGDESSAIIEIRFNCQVSYQHHEPQKQGDLLRIYLDPTTICNGVSPLAAQSRGRYRPTNADIAGLIDFEYEGDVPAGPTLTLKFSEAVSYTVDATPLTFELAVHVRRETVQVATPPQRNPDVSHRQVVQPPRDDPGFVINLESFRRIPTIADVTNLQLAPNQRIFYTEVIVEGTNWYRLRLGDFDSADNARVTLADLTEAYPEAWIDRNERDSHSVDLTVAVNDVIDVQPTVESPSGDSTALSIIDKLMEEARSTMVSGDRSRAIQIYTKVLQLPKHPRQAQAQEYLALAREKNGQSAHAKAEYQRYLSLYPDGDGATRVSQRLAVLLAGNRQTNTGVAASRSPREARKSKANDWRLQTYFSQYYRRDVNQQTDRDEIVSQSALYSDVNFDARRRGERFDFSSRVTAGYRNDFLGEDFGSGNDTRVSYAYADLADAVTGLRGRVGRQSRNSGGVLGRFDGVNIGYQASERVLLNTVVGKPAYSSSDGIDSERTFAGASIDYGPLWDGLELGLFFVQQEIDGISDRQAVGGEFRYFRTNQSFWGLVDYDTQYNELGSAFVQASWRIASRLTVNGSFDRRHSPFLSAGNAIIGQPVFNFSELKDIFSEEEIRELGFDRSPLSTSYSMGLSYTLSPRLQINADANQTSVDATPTSGGIFATPATRYRYFATSVVASSLFREGDVAVIGVRHSDSDTSKVMTLTVDSRYPFSRSLRINPRLRVDRRERVGDINYEWIYTPGVRVQYRRGQKFRLELELGKQFTQRDSEIVNLDRESYFINVGYQAFF